MGGRCLDSERAAEIARRPIQSSDREIRREIRGWDASANTITKSFAGQSRKASKG